MLQFKPITLSDKDTIQNFSSSFDSYSDFNFVSLYSWNVDENAEYCIIDGKIMLLKMSDYITGELFISCLSGHLPNTIITQIKKYCTDNAIDATLRLVPGITAHTMASAQIVEDIDSHDYVLSVELLMEMRANLFRGKRNLLNRFNRFYGEIATSRLLNLTNKTETEQILALNILWREQTTQTKEETESEYIAISRSIDSARELEIKSFGIFVGSELVAYTIFELLPHNGVILHFEKSNHTFIGAGEFIKNRFSLHIHETYGSKWINYEQDLGIENLRRAKESYKPIDKLKKYTVQL